VIEEIVTHPFHVAVHAERLGGGGWGDSVYATSGLRKPQLDVVARFTFAAPVVIARAFDARARLLHVTRFTCARVGADGVRAREVGASIAQLEFGVTFVPIRARCDLVALGG
jgi:hypothetical protein